MSAATEILTTIHQREDDHRMATVTKEKADQVAAAASKTANGELPGMPNRPELRTKKGRLVEHGSVSVTGGVSFDLRSQDAIDYLEGFAPGDTVELVVHGRVADNGDRSKLTKDGDTIIRRVAISIDYIDGSPNDAAQAALATAADDGEG